ncbi:MAG: type I glyceraldehyde-3-phosphate dehydrogenase [Candidatus Peribacteraceae bacterium]|nr:type I glyceraldehyde-3-phosphate dehydrogenase [Candidatus Peribacteraceae bacterium]
MIKVAINGYGRIGRNVHRQFVQRFAGEVEVVAINASSSAKVRSYLLRYDSLHGKFEADVRVEGEDMMVNGRTVNVVKERDPAQCPWKELGVDIVVEATGHFRTADAARGHLDAGAKRVIVTAPMKDETPTFVKGVNDHLLTKDMLIVSNASCTTNCIAPVIKVMDEAFGIEHLLVSSVHAYTVTQNLLDNKPEGDKDLRGARAATLSVIPSSTGAVKACGVIFPHLKGKMDGMAFRVPVPTVSCAYMAFSVARDTSTEEVNALLKKASHDPAFQDVLGISEEELVSIDFMTDPRSSIVDAGYTKVVDDKAVQILSWYDNEWGYAMRVTEMVEKMGKLMQ